MKKNLYKFKLKSGESREIAITEIEYNQFCDIPHIVAHINKEQHEIAKLETTRKGDVIFEVNEVLKIIVSPQKEFVKTDFGHISIINISDELIWFKKK